VGSEGKKEREVEEEAVQRVGLYSAESRHGAWRDSVAPTHVARLSLATSVAWPQALQRGSLVAPKHVVALKSRATELGATKRASFGNLDMHGLLLKY